MAGYDFISEQAKLALPDGIEDNSRRLAESDGPVVANFGVGQAAPEGIPYDFLREVFTKLGSASEEELAPITLYRAPRGNPDMLEAIKGILRRDGIEAKDANICVTTGALQAFSLVTRVLANPGDDVIVEAPAYSINLKTLKEAGLRVHGIPVEEDGMDVGKLGEVIEKGKTEGKRFRFIYVIPDFHNPTGYTMSEEKRKAIAAIARVHGIPVIEDGPYRLIGYEEGYKPLPLIYNMAPHVTVHIGTLSKVFGAGIRVGYVVGPEDFVEKVRCFKQGYDYNTADICQRIGAAYLGEGFEGRLARILAVQKEKRDLMLDLMDRHFPKVEGLSWNRPPGGLYIWVELPEGVDARRIWDDSLARGVGFVPGDCFFPDDSKRCDCFRLNFSFPSLQQIEAGIPILGEVLEKHLTQEASR